MKPRQVPRGPDHLTCPLHKKKMRDVCDSCPLWTQLRGKNPNTGEEIDEWNCSLAVLPLLLVENAMQTRQAAAATESFRNEVVRRAETVQRQNSLPHAPQIMIEGH